jgi:FdhD protein
MTASTQSVPITRFTSGTGEVQQDILTIEEPLGISIRYGMELHAKDLSVTMRTPGQDEELALGFLLSEGIVSCYEEVVGTVSDSPNQIAVILHEDVPFDPRRFERHVYTTSSCGICGKASIDAVRVANTRANAPQTWPVSASLLYRLPHLLRRSQANFEATGGLHASALFRTDGSLVMVREDVGRHNALDKLIGAAMQQELLPLREYILLLSGRASFELIQKASLAGMSFVASVGAPSHLAVELARESGMALVGFLRDQRFNVYVGQERILQTSTD